MRDETLKVVQVHQGEGVWHLEAGLTAMSGRSNSGIPGIGAAVFGV